MESEIPIHFYGAKADTISLQFSLMEPAEFWEGSRNRF